MTALATRDLKTTSGVPLIDILRNECFAEGFIDVAKARPFNSEFQAEDWDAWFYVRGRLVATEALSNFRRVPALWCETDAGSIINPQIISLAGAMFMTGAFT